MRLHTALMVMLLLQNGFALPAGGHSPASQDHESITHSTDTHCTNDDDDHRNTFGCNMDCQCPPGSGAGLLVSTVNMLTAPRLRESGQSSAQAIHAARADPPFRPPRLA